MPNVAKFSFAKKDRRCMKKAKNQIYFNLIVTIIFFAFG
jgi:hypothetical protein